jgi:hypothetical protein
MSDIPMEEYPALRAEFAAALQMAKSGYTDCACRDCFEIAISSTDAPELCHECVEAGCEPNAEQECLRDGAYGAEEEA